MHRVLWLRAAREALARFWVNADTVLRKAITTASHRVDQRLQSDPWTEGESRYGDTRVLAESPLTVYYEIHDDDMTVVVLQVRVFQKRKK